MMTLADQTFDLIEMLLVISQACADFLEQLIKSSEDSQKIQVLLVVATEVMNAVLKKEQVDVLHNTTTHLRHDVCVDWIHKLPSSKSSILQTSYFFFYFFGTVFRDKLVRRFRNLLDEVLDFVDCECWA